MCGADETDLATGIEPYGQVLVSSIVQSPWPLVEWSKKISQQMGENNSHGAVRVSSTIEGLA